MVATTYNADSQPLTVTAKNPMTGDQTTRNVYGTTLADSAIARNDLLAATIYPDAADSADRVSFTYNRQREQTTKTDQNGTVHAYSRDLLGRQTSDTVPTLGPRVDGSVKRIDTAYEVRGMVKLVTSYADTAGSIIVNQVLRTFNTFAQLAIEYQQHSGAVNTSTSPKVQYAYADGSANTIRRTSTTYPDTALVVGLTYASGDDGALSRVTAVAGAFADYIYLGLASIAGATHLTNLHFSLATGSGPNPYAALDGFGRLLRVFWKTSSGTALVDLSYTYDRAGNRTSRRDAVAEAAGKSFDELYGYDAMQRLTALARGTLAESNTVITNPILQQGWELDATGNWSSFTNVDQTNAANTLDQQRTSNPANEITAIARTVGAAWATPAYDRNGNMSSVPQPAAMDSSYAAAWDAWNRLVELADGSTPVQENAFDGLGRRTQRLAYIAGILSDTRDYYYSDQWQILQEMSTALPATPGLYVWGLRYIDDLIVRSGFAGAGPGWPLQDANWNVVALFDNVHGVVGERYAYTAYGVPQFLDGSFNPISSSAYAWEVLYCGYRCDSAAGLYSVRFRELHPVLGSWLRVDPLGLFQGSNPLRYVQNNPGNGIDPSGLAPVGTFTITFFTQLEDTLKNNFQPLSAISNMHLLWNPPAPQNPKAKCPQCNHVGLFQIASTQSLLISSIGYGWIPFLGWSPTQLQDNPWHLDETRSGGGDEGAQVLDYVQGYPQLTPGVPGVAFGLSGALASEIDQPGLHKNLTNYRNTTIAIQQMFETGAVCLDRNSPRYGEVFGVVFWGHKYVRSQIDPAHPPVSAAGMPFSATLYVIAGGGEETGVSQSYAAGGPNRELSITANGIEGTRPSSEFIRLVGPDAGVTLTW